MRPVLLLALLLAGCGEGDHWKDAGVVPDMAVSPADLASAAADMVTSACNPSANVARAQYVWNAIQLPTQKSDYAWDLNGDGHVDNGLGNIEAALTAQGVDPQADENTAVMSGQSVTLLDERSIDSTFTNDGCATSNVSAGTPTASPDFSGHGHFAVDAGATVGAFTGTLTTALFVSQPAPAEAKVPVTLRLPLSLLGTISVDIVGARITYVRAADGSIPGGQVNGAIRQQDVQTKVIPEIADTLNLRVHADPSSTQSMQALSTFDNGGAATAACGTTCQNLDGSCAKANDGVISDCEVASSQIIQTLLAPDVQLFDADGNYHPNPANTHKDSLSIGIGFTAVPATF